MLATTMSHWQDAEQRFEDALTTNANMGARTWLAHTQYDDAVMLLARSQPGDTQKASASSPPPPRTDLDDLSPREIEVLRLLASGKSNQEIAEALFISRNTVSTHVRNILPKTGSANRTAAAAYAMRHGLSEV